MKRSDAIDKFLDEHYLRNIIDYRSIDYRRNIVEYGDVSNGEEHGKEGGKIGELINDQNLYENDGRCNNDTDAKNEFESQGCLTKKRKINEKEQSVLEAILNIDAEEEAKKKKKTKRNEKEQSVLEAILNIDAEEEAKKKKKTKINEKEQSVLEAILNIDTEEEAKKKKKTKNNKKILIRKVTTVR